MNRTSSRMIVLGIGLAALALFGWVRASGEDPAASSPSFFTVDQYDLEADPAKQFVATLARAKKENKRIILLVGGNWCPWCRAISHYLVETESVRAILDEHYLVQKVACDSDEQINREFLKPLGYIADFPHIFIHDSSGKQIHSQYVYELEKDSSYDEEAFIAFLEKWKD